MWWRRLYLRNFAEEADICVARPRSALRLTVRSPVIIPLAEPIMQSFPSRAGRWPLAITLCILGACADEPTTPSLSAPSRPSANLGDVITITNVNDSGIGSLRWALKFTTGGEILRFDPTLAGQTIALDSALWIQKSVTIEGPSSDGITIRGPGVVDDRMIWARFSGHVIFRNVSITGGHTINGVGSAIYAESDLTFENSTIYDNVADAGVAIFGEHVTLINSTVTGTIKGNANTYDYPAVMGDTVTLINSTVTNNGWGGVGAFNGVVNLRNSIVANNAAKNCVILSGGTIVRQGANISDDDSCGGPTEITITDPKLGPLADNGGPTRTHALLTGSPAIGAAVGCSVQVDQRYAPRDAQCDLGAFEFLDFTTVQVTIDPTTAVKHTNGWAVLTGTIQCSRPETFKLALELHQPQRVGKDVVDVHSAATEPIACSTVVRPWSASMVLTDGVYQNGSATATAQTFDAEPWVASASASAQVKLYWSRGK
jgi:hypothetical protein